jgi:hypothetical protein
MIEKRKEDLSLLFQQQQRLEVQSLVVIGFESCRDAACEEDRWLTLKVRLVASQRCPFREKQRERMLSLRRLQ